jgi:18S rRNA (guanine1575-N7)-methyltransferase
MWKIKNSKRPEKNVGAIEYYGENTPYASSSAIRRIQSKITLRALELAMFPLDWKILDAGCGNGFSLEILREIGYSCAGFDVSPSMIALAKKKGFVVKVGDLRKIPFVKASFDAIISVSALQWIGVVEASVVASEFKRVLKKNGRAVIQFYPESEKQLMAWAKAFKNAGFSVVVKQEGLDSPRKRRVFLLLS